MNGKVRTLQFFHHKMICKSFNVRFLKTNFPSNVEKIYWELTQQK